jgi:hypothetical protein
MSCFWVGLINKIPIYHFNKYLPDCLEITIPELISFLKTFNSLTENVIWQGQFLEYQLMIENSLRIDNLSLLDIGNGYDCSSCEPVLLLICQLFEVNIDHNYNQKIIKYRNIKNINIETADLFFTSDLGHFQ